VTGLKTFRTLLPVSTASAVWYGFLVFVGQQAGRNWSAIEATFSRLISILGWVAIPVGVVGVVWWWLSRRRHRHRDG
jgi:membrane protein DedA with SNARE-associated domain